MNKTTKVQWWLTIAALVISALLLAPFIGSAIWSNVGMLLLRNELLSHPRSSAGTYSIYGILDDKQVYQKMQSSYQVLTLDGNRFSARSTMGRLALATGDTQAAANLLSPLIEQAEHRPFVYQDVVTALGYAEKENVATLCEITPPPQRTQATSDMVALACLESRTAAVTGPVEAEALQGMVAWRPGDLYANYLLWKDARRTGDTVAADAYRKKLVYFSLEAIHPSDERLLDYACEVIPPLLDEKLWSREKAINVVSFLVWQHSKNEAVEQLLKQFIEQYPTEPDWLFYLGELYHRRSDWNRAGEMYLQVLKVDPAYAQAYLRLGMVTEARSLEHLSEAARWYEQYHQMAPDDLLGLKKVTEVSEALGRQEAIQLRKELETKTEGLHFVAQQLHVPVESITLGPNLIDNGDFKAWVTQDPSKWRLGTYLGPSGDQGLYTVGQDALMPEGRPVIILTLWGGMLSDGTVTYAEYTGKGFPVTSTQYLVSIYYCTLHFTEGSGLLFVSSYANPDSPSLVNQPLPDTDGQWQVIHILVEGPTTPVHMIPLIRVWGVGQLSIESYKIRTVVVKEDSLP